MNTARFIAKRYFFSRSNRNAVNVISGISAFGYGIGTFALIVILSVLNGFENILFTMYSDYNPDLKVLPLEGKIISLDSVALFKLQNLKSVEIVAPIVEDNAMMRNDENQVLVTIKGVSNDYFKATHFTKYIKAGDSALEVNGNPLCLLGAGVDNRLNTNLNGDYEFLTVMLPTRESFSVANPQMVEEKIIPGGIFVMDDDLHNRLVIVPISFARSLFERQNQYTSLEIKLKKDVQVEDAISEISSSGIKNIKIQDRKQQQETLYNMFKAEKWVTFAILCFVLMLVSFNLVGSLSMLVMDKRADILTLNGLGANKSFIRKIFLTEGLLVTGVGVLGGLIAGVILCWLQQQYHIITNNNSMLPSYPVQLRLSDIFLVLFTTFALGTLSSIYPALKAGNLKS